VRLFKGELKNERPWGRTGRSVEGYSGFSPERRKK
jgi:hypothetical protein